MTAASLEGKVVVVTGGSAGIGRAAARQFAAAGAHVVATGRRPGPIAALADGIVGIVADVAVPRDAARTIVVALDRFGRIDVLVNNAGAGAILPLSEVTAPRIEEILAVNVVGPSLLAAAALPHLAASRGAIVNVSSTFGHKPAPGLSHYGASKAALEHLTRSWALELAPQRVRVNAVAAGPTDTGALTGMMGLSASEAAAIETAERERIPLGRRGHPDDVARWIVALSDPAASWVTGEVITVDGGLGLA